MTSMVSNIPIENQHQVQSNKLDNSLQTVKKLLFSLGVIGQWIFVYYIVDFYGGIAISGEFEKVNEQLPHGVIEGDPIGNFMLGIHIFLAAIITFGGPLQFFSGLRNRLPLLHRWIGRFYFPTAVIIAGAGLYMNYTRGAHGGFINGMGNALNAAFILIFSVLAWQSARNRNFAAHKKWAIRAFLMVSGVWFFRLGYSLWILLSGFTMVGTTENLTGPFDRFLAFGHSLIPLLILEIYFFAKATSNLKIKRISTLFLAFLCLLLCAGIFMLTKFFWLPLI